MGPIARVKIKSTVERKVKTTAKKGIFLVRKWINNAFNSKFCEVPHASSKKSLLFV